MKLFRVEIIRVLRVGISTRTWAFITVRSPECVSVNNFKRVVNTHTQTLKVRHQYRHTFSGTSMAPIATESRTKSGTMFFGHTSGGRTGLQFFSNTTTPVALVNDPMGFKDRHQYRHT